MNETKNCNRCRVTKSITKFRVLPDGSTHKFCIKCEAEYKAWIKKKRK